jgi:hypothetical protein
VVQRAEFVEEEPGADMARAGQGHEAVDGDVHPHREHRPVERHVDVARGHEQDRGLLAGARGPGLDREGFALVGQEHQRLGMGVEHAAHRVRHALGLGVARVGDGALETVVDLVERRGHQRADEVPVGALALGAQLRAHLDEDGARGLFPEAAIGAIDIGNERFGGGEELAVMGAVVEHRPVLAALVVEVEDIVAGGIVEALDEGAGEVEDHAGIAALEGLGDEAAQRRGLARAGGAEGDDMVLFAIEREGDGGDLIGGTRPVFLRSAKGSAQASWISMSG